MNCGLRWTQCAEEHSTNGLAGLVACRLPEDVEQLERVNSAMSNLATDNDRDVAAEARAINDLFKRTPVSLRSPACLCHHLIMFINMQRFHIG